MRTKPVRRIFVALILGLVINAGNATAQTFELKLQHPEGPSSPLDHPIYTNLAEKIEQYTSGRVKIKIFSAGMLVPDSQLFMAVAKGQIDMTIASPGYWSGTMSIGTIQSGPPGSYKNVQDADTLLHNPELVKIFRDEYAKRGLYYFGECMVGPDGQALVLKKPIQRLSDLKGLKIRASGEQQNAVSALGANPVNIPKSDVYSAFATGVIDGTLQGLDGAVDGKHYEIAKYVVHPVALGASVCTVLMNKKVWDSLGKDLQGKVTAAYEEWQAWEVASVQDIFNAEKTLRAKGMNFIELPESELTGYYKALDSVWDKISSRDAVAAKCIKIYRDYYNK
jgi:TRAP-type C4-dicarboxylate transport system substrate-binding protein